METIYVAIQTFVYSLLLYSMIGFEWDATKFLWFYYYVFMCFVYFTLYGMMLVALTPSYQIAAIVMSFFLSFWNLFSGFLIPRMVRNTTLLNCIDVSFSHNRFCNRNGLALLSQVDVTKMKILRLRLFPFSFSVSNFHLFENAKT